MCCHEYQDEECPYCGALNILWPWPVVESLPEEERPSPIKLNEVLEALYL